MPRGGPGDRRAVPARAGAARELYTAAEARGHGEDDFAAVLEAVEGLAGTRL